MNLKLLGLLALSSVPVAMAGPFAYALCQTGCNMVAVGCYAASGFTFGTVAAPAAPQMILACNAAQGACMAACAATALLAPIP
ncbi:hypothetical protein F5J12DRAFT_858457 [Pisolithus orientalis]|uniref:uncharacterized protein n=1 Tax=Pisolithus orientalis TaxID=936130 RepID=UPI00222412B7|nr:uncharacterized protein F5J12DRAFT_858457 [Pisolithus orientalis]KAI5993706.1 hypothetical protein F5J12DRAFT_858457 [Pisolithus orientalis]